MKLLRETIRRILIERSQGESPALAFLKDLGAQVDKYNVEYGTSHYFSIYHDNCIVTLSAEIPDEEDAYVHLGYLYVTNNERKIDPKCFRKGYAGDLLQLVIDSADRHGVTLGLSAKSVYTPEYLQRKYGQEIDTPDTEELAKFYSRYGFEETHRFSQQIFMERPCR